MAPVPAGQPGVRLPGAEPGAPPPHRRLIDSAVAALLALLAAFTAYRMAAASGVKDNFAEAALHPAARAALAAVGMFFVCGFGPTRLLLPVTLRRHALLWVVPVGACVSAIALTVLGFAAVPFDVSLGLVLGLGALTALLSLRRRSPRTGGPPRASRGAIAWAVYLAALLAVVAIIPMMRSGFVTVVGDGSDAHLAAGTAAFLQHYYPTSVHPEAPVDRVPLVWRSKQPVYYALAASASLSGLETFESLSTIAGVMLALAAIGFFLVARELFGTGVPAAGAAMAIVGLDRMVLHTAMHPYFNQTWGLFAMPFALVLAWTVVGQRPAGRTRGSIALLCLFLAIEAFAYPLALPIPLLALAAFALSDRRSRRRRGEPVASLDPRRLYRGRRSLVWLVPLALALAVPIVGVTEKAWTAAAVVLIPGRSLTTWGGDLSGYFPEHDFLALGSYAALLTAGPVLLVAAVLSLRRSPRALAAGLGTVLLFGALAAIVFRLRATGYYFHFKVLAFVGPLALVCAVAGLARWRWAGAVLTFLLFASAESGAVAELGNTYDQLPRTILAVRGLESRLPRSASIRLDMNPNEQIWVAYLLPDQPLCSERPLLDTSYPHVPISRRADYILADQALTRPVDAVPAPRQSIGQFWLYRARAGLPGPNRCSQRMVQTVTAISSE